MKPIRMWTILDAKGRIFPNFISRTRGEAIAEFCYNGDEAEGGSPPDDWRDWQKRGYSAARVTITKDTPEMTDSKEAIVSEMQAEADALDALNKEHPTLRDSTVALAARTFRKFSDRLSRLEGEVENGPGKYAEAMMGLPKRPRLASAQTQEAGVPDPYQCTCGYPADRALNHRRYNEPCTPAAPPAVSSEDAALRQQLGDLFGIGSEVRTNSTILANAENTLRFARMLDAIEREFFMVPGVPDISDPDFDPEDEVEPVCLLNRWGSTVEQYVEQFRAALSSLAQPK